MSMREIKFRAYGNHGFTKQKADEKKMIYNFEISREMEDVGINGGDYYDVMQYTGLKDKNGVEIYDGDIVNLFPEYDDMSTAYEIKYDGCSFKIDCGLTPYNTNLEEICKKIKVIGNIYENPLQSN